MADKTEIVTLDKGTGDTNETVVQTWVDMGDGTHAPKSVATLNSENIALAPNTYLGDEQIAGNDANQNATLPAGTKTVWVQAKDGPVYCQVNGVAAVATASFYVPENTVRLIGPFSNLTSLGVFAATGDTAYLVYES